MTHPACHVVIYATVSTNDRQYPVDRDGAALKTRNSGDFKTKMDSVDLNSILSNEAIFEAYPADRRWLALDTGSSIHTSENIVSIKV
jgi:hypothetical protein